MTTATPSLLRTTQVFSGARELARRATRRSRRERGIDDYLAAERAQRFDRQERAELRRLFFDIVDES
jgi:glutamate formiminotransferase